jgi:nitrile hydratase
MEPRAVLREFDFYVSDDTEIRVWDANADIRYLVLPMRPSGTEDLSGQQLADLVTRDSMIGVGPPLSRPPINIQGTGDELRS